MLTISISFTLYITNLLSFVNSETQLDHTVNPLCVHSRLLKFSWKEKSWDTSISILNFPVTPVANLKRESRGEECSLKKQHNQILHRLVTLVGFHPLSQVLNCGVFPLTGLKFTPGPNWCRTDAVVWVDLKMLLGGHVAHGRGVPQCLRLHDALHVCRPAVLNIRISLFGNHKTI